MKMKLKLLLCGTALVLLAGCASPQNQFAVQGEFSYTSDLVPQPLPDLTPNEVDKINQVQPEKTNPSGQVGSANTFADKEYVSSGEH
jgi:hypothetical protein